MELDSPEMPKNQAVGFLLVVHPGAELYGSDRVMLESVSALIQRGWSVTVALPNTGPLFDAVKQAGACVLTCPTPVVRKSVLQPKGFASFLGTLFRSLLPSLRVLRSTRADVVYVSTVTVPLWILLSRICRVPVVCHVHEAENSARTLQKRALNTPLLLCSSVVANSEFSLNLVCESFPKLASRSRVILNPISGPSSIKPAREMLTDPIRLLYLGRLSPRKGPQFILSAMAQLRDLGMMTQLHLVGSAFKGYEWFEEELRAQVNDLHLDSNVEFLGFQRDVWAEIALCDLVVVPSVDAEPFGNVAVEAVLGARAVVASESGGLIEAVRGFPSAQSVRPGNSTAIAAAIKKIAEDWNTYRAEAEFDALLAKQRHDPELYGDRIFLAVQTASRAHGRQ
ncbi:glycosyltransferase [Actinobacteria bacterium IMCC26207]|nr:glycosyltransferase [Actinobacteria bacterium IMCC26207]